jgi:hypothetical protein
MSLHIAICRLPREAGGILTKPLKMGNDGFFRILTFSGYVSQNSRAATAVKFTALFINVLLIGF